MENEKGTGGKGDRSGKGRERRSDEAFPKHRDSDELGTHGGPRQGAGAGSEEGGRREGVARGDEQQGA